MFCFSFSILSFFQSVLLSVCLSFLCMPTCMSILLYFFHLSVCLTSTALDSPCHSVFFSSLPLSLSPLSLHIPFFLSLDQSTFLSIFRPIYLTYLSISLFLSVSLHLICYFIISFFFSLLNVSMKEIKLVSFEKKIVTAKMRVLVAVPEQKDATYF